MKRRDYAYATPRQRDPEVKEEALLSFTSGYVQRAIHDFPKQGSRAPWRLRQNYALDLLDLRHSRLDDGVLEFHRPEAVSAVRVAAART